MKKIAAAILIALLFFNWCGYRLLTMALQQANDHALEKKLDQKAYTTSDLIEISIPMDLPYAFDWAGFERCDGEVTWNGMQYKYVERKLENGQMRYRCLPNHEKQRLHEAGNRFFAMVNDLGAGNNNSDGNPGKQQAKNLISDFDHDLYSWTLMAPFKDISALIPTTEFFYTSPYRSTCDKPPCIA